MLTCTLEMKNDMNTDNCNKIYLVNQLSNVLGIYFYPDSMKMVSFVLELMSASSYHLSS